MADDEAASYWEHVYGQPIHIYPKEKMGPAGELERMTDEEYASYVRQKMYEKTQAGLLEEKARREEAKRRRTEERSRKQAVEEEVERSLRRGEERRQRRAWREAWEAYSEAWASWEGDAAGLAWPVRGGRGTELKEEAVRQFYVQGLDRASLGPAHFAARLKEERVRWHPDKMQQRLGGRVAADLMRDITAVFQVIDSLWEETGTVRE